MDKSRIRNKMFADTNESGYVWTGPQTLIVFYFRVFYFHPILSCAFVPLARVILGKAIYIFVYNFFV